MRSLPAWLVILSVLLAVGVIAWLVDWTRRGWPRYWLDTLWVRRVARRESRKRGNLEQRKARLVDAIRDYYGDDLRRASRQDRRRFANEFADVIMDTLTGKGD